MADLDAQTAALLKPFVQDGQIVTGLNDPHVKIGGTNLAALFCAGYVDVLGNYAKLTQKGRKILEKYPQPAS